MKLRNVMIAGAVSALTFTAACGTKTKKETVTVTVESKNSKATKKENAKLQNDLAAAKKEVSTQKSVIDALNKQNGTTLTAGEVVTNSKTADLISYFQTKTEQDFLALLNSDVERTNAAVTSTQDTKSAAIIALDAAQSHLATKQAELTSAHDKLAASEATSAQLKNKLADLKSSKESNAEATKTAQADFDSAASAMTAKVTAAGESAEEVVRLDMVISTQKSEIEKNKAELANVGDNKDRSNELQTAIVNSEVTIAQAEADKATAEKKVAELKAEVPATQAAVATTEGKLSDLQKAGEEIETSLASTEAEIVGYDDATNGSIAKMKADVESATEAVGRAQVIVDAAKMGADEFTAANNAAVVEQALFASRLATYKEIFPQAAPVVAEVTEVTPAVETAVAPAPAEAPAAAPAPAEAPAAAPTN